MTFYSQLDSGATLDYQELTVQTFGNAKENRLFLIPK